MKKCLDSAEITSSRIRRRRAVLLAAIGDSSVTDLDLSGVDLGASGEHAAAALAASLLKNRALRQLNLANFHCGDNTATILAALGGAAMSHRPGAAAEAGCRKPVGGVERLDISGWALGAADAKALRGSLLRGSPLRELTAASCRAGPHAAVGCADGLVAAGGSACLRRLDLTSTRIGPTGARCC